MAPHPARARTTGALVTSLDHAALAACCETWARSVEVETARRRHGVLVKSPNGFPMQSPYLAAANATLDQMRIFLTEFGMTPASRSRVSAAPQADQEDPFAEHLMNATVGAVTGGRGFSRRL